jgi:hypothetical protein
MSVPQRVAMDKLMVYLHLSFDVRGSNYSAFTASSTRFASSA